jgi:dUTP pyrophosphatase
MKLGVVKLREDAIVPTRGSKDASGLDLSAVEDVLIPAGKTLQVKTGIAFDIPAGFEIQVRPRSGLSLKTGLRLANSVGTVDKDYQGDCSALIWNTSQEDYLVKRGDRIAQAVLAPVVILEPELMDGFTKDTDRGTSGFGSTGV